MNHRITLCIFIVTVSVANMSAQSISKLGVLDPFTDPGLNLVEYKPPESRLIGDAYLLDVWQMGRVYLKTNHRLQDNFLNYELLYHVVEIRNGESSRYCPIDLIDSLVIYDRTSGSQKVFLNASSFPAAEGTQLVGLLEILVDGTISLVMYHSAWIKESNYNTALDAGSRDHKIIKEQELYYIRDHKLIPVPKGKKDIIGFFNNQQTEIVSFIDSNRLNPKTTEDLMVILQHYNSLNNQP